MPPVAKRTVVEPNDLRAKRARSMAGSRLKDSPMISFAHASRFFTHSTLAPDDGLLAY